MFRFLLSLLLACSMLTVSAQTPNAKRILNQIQRSMRSSLFLPQEKVYLHFDNTGYFQGETMYFKAYLLRTDTGLQSDLSHVLYVDLLTPNGSIVARRKLKVTNGLAEGDITLDNILLTGYYEVRAYTRYMTNWGTNACFSRVFPIYKQPRIAGQYQNPAIDKVSYRERLLNLRSDELADDSVNAAIKSNNKQFRSLKVRFYPEGGNLVSGLESNVAYTVIDGDSEVVRDIIKVKPTDISPLSVNVDKTTYQLSFAQNQKGTYQLPAALPEGIVMQLDVTQPEHVVAHLSASSSLQNQVLGYALMHNGVVSQSDTLVIGAGKQLAFCRDSLKAGVNQLTLFMTTGQILADRLFWIMPKGDAADTISLVATNEYLKLCGLVSFDIQSRPHSSLSFSAVDAASTTDGREGNARTNLLLSSDLRGYVAHPEYYFESDDETHRRAADLLMLVQGWRRYDWQLYNGYSPRLHSEPIEDRLVLMGKILPRRSRQKVENTLVKATMYNRRGQVLEGEFTTSADGGYLFDLPDVDDDWTLLMTSQQEEKNKNFIISIDRHFAPENRFLDPQEAQSRPVNQQGLRWKKADANVLDVPIIKMGDYILDEVVVKKRYQHGFDGFAEEAGAKATSMQFFDCDAITESIIDKGEEIPGFDEWLVSLSGEFEGSDIMSDPVAVTLEGYEADSNSTQPIQFFRDGLSYRSRPILWIINNMFWGISKYTGSTRLQVLYNEELSAFMDFPVFLDEVRSVYISEDIAPSHIHFHSPQIDDIQPVILYVYTHRTVQIKTKGLRRTHYQGFNVPKVFEMEDYSVIAPMEDFRRTLYWTPSVTTDAEGKAHVEFYNNSSCQEMYLSVEGISRDGHILVNQ